MGEIFQSLENPCRSLSSRALRDGQPWVANPWKICAAVFLLLGAAQGALDYNISTLAGQVGTNGSANGTGVAAQFYQPGGIVVASNGTMYVADSANHTIRTITPAGVVTTFVGSAGLSGTNDGSGATARFSFPQGLALDSSGNLLVADTGNSTIRKITPAGVVSTVAGSAGLTGTNDGTGAAARFLNPYGVAVDAAGNLMVTDTGNDTIRKITPLGEVTTFAGQAGTSGSSDGAGNLASFFTPTGLIVDGSNNVFVADTDNSKIRRIDAAGNVSTFAGAAEPGNLDGNGTAASFSQPYGLALDAVGNLYVADKGNGALRRISTNADVTTSVNSTNLVGGIAPQAVAVDTTGNVFLADTGKHVIRRGVLTGGGLILVQANNTNAGSVGGAGLFVAGSNVQLIATASNGWSFLNWNDGNTNSTRTLSVSTSATYTANFAAAATITVSASTNDGGFVTGSGVFFVGSNATLTATASNGWWFLGWNDGVTNNPRTIVVTSNMNFTAVFAPTVLLTVLASPASGGSVALDWYGVPADVPWANTNTYVSVRSNGLYNAFPSMASDGTNGLLVAFDESNSHAKGTGAVYFATMTYGGTLGAPVMVATNTATTHPLAPVIFRSSSGKLLYAYSLVYPTSGVNQTNFLQLCTSTNNGATWSAPVGILPAASNFMGNVVSPMLQIGSRIVMPFWSVNTNAAPASGYGSYTIESTDDGETWGNVRMLGYTDADGWDETAIAHLGGSNNYALAFRSYSNTFNAARSTDAAQTWGAFGVAFLGAGRPTLTRMADGRLISVYRSRSGYPYTAYRYSNDSGTNWSSEVVLDTQFITAFEYAAAVEVRSNVLAVLYGVQPGGNATNICWLRLKYIIDGIGISPAGDVVQGVSLATYSAGGDIQTGGGAYLVGSTAWLTATASNNWLFVDWNDGSAVNPRTITVPPTNITYTANFAAAATITVATSTNIGGSVTGNGTFFVGSNALLTATASNGWWFLSWNDGVTNNPRTIVVASNMNYTAVFAPTAVLTAQANPASGGSVSGGGTYVVGSHAVLAATASNQWLFTGWNDGATNSPRTVVVPEGGATYTANFSPLAAVEVQANPTNGGSVTGGGLSIVGSNATVTATASNSWLFISWTGGVTNNPWTFSVPEGGVICTANFARISTVTVQANPTNGGSVSGGGTYIVGSNATLTATASNNWVFTSWTGGMTNNPLSIVVPSTNISYTANFAELATLTVAASTNVGGSVTGGGTFFVGSNATLTATASNGWLFVRWSDGSTNNPRTVAVSSGGASYTAVFAPTALLTVLANPTSGGSVTGGGTFVVGSTNWISATASNAWWRFLNWNDSNTNTSRSIVMPAGGATYTANFGQLSTVTLLASPTNGGSVAGGGSYLVGSNATITATASNGWVFVNWNGTTTNNPWTFAVPASATVCTAYFARLSVVTVVASPTNGGVVTGGGTYIAGSNATLSATPTSHWAFGGWNDGNTNAIRSVTVPTTNISYTATFLAPATITVGVAPPAGGNVSGGGTYPPGTNIALLATPNAGWGFLNWTDGASNNPRTVTVPVGGAGYTARFASVAGLGTALDAPQLTWSVGGSAAWAGQASTTHGTASAAQSGAISAGQQTYFQTTTNGPMSLMFWWKVSAAANNHLQFYINTQLVSQISGNVDWNQYVTFLGTTNQYTLKWVYTKTSATVSGSDAGWVDQVTWLPCPYATHVPQLFFQEPGGMIASWVVGTNGAFQFARVLANTGAWALKSAGDIDGDGVSDLLFQNTASDTGGWFLNPDGSVRDARFWFNIGGWEIKACADYDGTGRGQVFFQNASGVAAYWRLDTNGAFQSAVVLGSMAGWKLRGAGDLDGDHKADLFWQNTAGAVTIWYHNPDGSIRAALAFSTGEWALCGVTDVDADGVCDLLWQTPDTRTGGWFMQTNGLARDARFWWPTGGWKLKAAGR